MTKDSGNRRTFETGAVRDRAKGKGRYDLLSPIAIDRLAKLYERGGEKYDPRNWEKGMPLSQFVDSGLRHFFNYLEGKREEDHLAAVMWNSAGAIYTEEMIKRKLLPISFDDMPNYLTTDDRISKGL